MPRVKIGSDLSAAHRRYQCRDGWLALACRHEADWKALAKCLGRPELAYPHAWKAALTAPPQGPLARLLEAIFIGEPVVAWVQRLRAHGVSCAPARRPPSETQAAGKV